MFYRGTSVTDLLALPYHQFIRLEELMTDAVEQQGATGR